MAKHILTRKRVSPSVQSPAGDWLVSPPKRMLVTQELKTITILDLPEKIIHQILSRSDLQQLGILSQVCRQFNNFSTSFLFTNSSIPVLFYSMTSATADQAVVKYFISGSTKEHGLDMSKARTNFKQLGRMIKKLTCLLSTRERVMLSTRVMSRLSLCSSLSPSSQLMSLCEVFLHRLVHMWADDECLLAAGLVFNTFNSGGNSGAVTAVMSPIYRLGSRPELEMQVRNFLASVFYKEVPSDQRGLWLETLLL